jgi:hypothetical protein
MEAALARHAHSAWYPEAREIWDNWTTRALAATDPGEVRDILGSVCKTMVRERLWYGTRRFDRQSMETFGATPAPKKASKGPSQRRSSAYHKRHALDRSHRIALARPSRMLRSLEDDCQPLLPLAEGRGVGSHTKSPPEPKRPRGRARLGGPLPRCDHS